ncbi:uncharacterized protein Tco025E_04134 [Trypanosoma conorhini]|uniref:Uncharacterized protein n=1 Tax=Trypanosoma conorhini TaxID=83891 RepID=A0A3R7P8V6_9TRYP|nr:uncharacterized protein Tco025E_04134 [Trypanosoma conorhini]RNF19433.1 hypothetical protein Tco025E_04134 [Trypanosoma conorhini]
MAGEPVAKSLRGVARVPPAAAPVTRASSGLLAAVSFAVDGGHDVLVTATLRADDTRQGELTFLTVAADNSAMILARRAFSFNAEPLFGIAKVVCAGVSVVAVMSSSGEVVCVRSGLRENDVEDDASDSEEGDAETFVNAVTHALDLCAVTVAGCPFVLTSGHQKVQGFSFPLQHAGGELRHECRELNVGPFHSIAGVADYRHGPALLLGCTLGSVVVLEWGSPLDEPTVIRSILMGPSTRYLGVAVDALLCSGSHRIVTFCGFGATTLEEQEEGTEFFSLHRTDGVPFETRKASGARVSSLPAWNTVCRDAPCRPHAEGFSLVVTRPQLHRPSSVAHHALLVRVSQPGLAAVASGPHGVADGGVASLSSSINVSVMDAGSTDCKKALAKLTSAVSVLPTLRRTLGRGSHAFLELGLCDGRCAVFFGLTEDRQMKPCSVLQIEGSEDRLLGCSWLPQSRGAVMVLSGTLHRVVEEASEKQARTSDAAAAAVVGELVLSSRDPLPWEGVDVSAPVTLEQVREVVRTTVRQENERMSSRLEERLASLEHAMSLLLRDVGKQSGNGRVCSPKR